MWRRARNSHSTNRHCPARSLRASSLATRHIDRASLRWSQWKSPPAATSTLQRTAGHSNTAQGTGIRGNYQLRPRCRKIPRSQPRRQSSHRRRQPRRRCGHWRHRFGRRCHLANRHYPSSHPRRHWCRRFGRRCHPANRHYPSSPLRCHRRRRFGQRCLRRCHLKRLCHPYPSLCLLRCHRWQRSGRPMKLRHRHRLPPLRCRS